MLAQDRGSLGIVIITTTKVVTKPAMGVDGDLVAPSVFKTVSVVVIPRRVGSIPTYSRHYSRKGFGVSPSLAAVLFSARDKWFCTGLCTGSFCDRRPTSTDAGGRKNLLLAGSA